MRETDIDCTDSLLLPPDMEDGEQGLLYPFELPMSMICPEDEDEEEGLGLTQADGGDG